MSSGGVLDKQHCKCEAGRVKRQIVPWQQQQQQQRKARRARKGKRTKFIGINKAFARRAAVCCDGSRRLVLLSTHGVRPSNALCRQLCRQLRYRTILSISSLSGASSRSSMRLNSCSRREVAAGTAVVAVVRGVEYQRQQATCLVRPLPAAAALCKACSRSVFFAVCCFCGSGATCSNDLLLQWFCE